MRVFIANYGVNIVAFMYPSWTTNSCGHDRSLPLSRVAFKTSEAEGFNVTQYLT